MNCSKCGRAYRMYVPWFEPPENHFYRCEPCGVTIYPYDPDDDDSEGEAK